MESFEGLFICSTNLVDKLDSASLRRFDIKIKFDYLNREQRWTLFREVIKAQGQRMRNARALKTRLDQLGNLTPGDFATVVRQNRLANAALTPAGLLDALVQEAKFKRDGQGTGIGFTAVV
jgi:SpoVK/Ycf46/Vps4 family AAA+-type ATPase